MPLFSGATIAVLALFMALPAFGLESDKLRLDQPEVEIAKAQANLRNIDQSIKAAKNLSTQHGLGPQNILSDRALEAAREYFQQRDYFSAAKYYRRYTQLKQKPKLEHFLEAYYRIGVAHENLSEAMEAFVAYTNYLAIFPTTEKKNYADLIDVLERMVASFPEDKVAPMSLSETLAAIVALDVPDNVRPEVLYLAASAVAANNQRRLAITWLERARELTKKQDLLAKISYIKGLISLASADITAAEDNFARALTEAPPAHPIRELVYLALARISVKKEKYQLALRYYGKVSEKSSAHREALYESTFVAIKSDRAPTARAKGQQYLSQYHSTADALKIRQLLAYLDLNSGSLGQARAGITSVNKQLTELTGFLRGSLGDTASVPTRVVYDIDQAASFLINHPPMMQDAIDVLSFASRLESRLLRLRSSVKNTILTAGQGSLENLNPEWQNNIRQMGDLGKRLLRVGHRLSALEQGLYGNAISKPDRLRLSRNRERRQALSSPHEKSQAKNINWQKVGDIIDINLKIARLMGRLDKLSADEKTAAFLANQQGGQKTSYARRQAQKVQQIRDELMTHLEQARLEHITNLSLLHKDLSSITYFLKYFALLYEENTILQQYRGNRDNATAALNGRELQETWQYWRHLVGILTNEYDQSQKTIAQSLSNLVAKLDRQNKQIASLQDQISQIRATVEATLGTASGEIFQGYIRQINSRLSKHGKWSADIEWLEYLGTEKSKHDLVISMQFEKQVLDETLEDIQRGVIAKWPD